MFPDESKFMVDFNACWQHVFRHVGERHSNTCVKEDDRYGKATTMVWSGISHYGKTDLIFINGRGCGAALRNRREGQQGFTAQRYINQILRPVVLPYFAANSVIVLQQDNARAHSARVTQQFLQDSHIPVHLWPTYSPDINPIEHLWDYLKQKIHALDLQNIGELQAALLHEWDAVPMDCVRKLVGSMRRRCTAVIRTRGGHTRY